MWKLRFVLVLTNSCPNRTFRDEDVHTGNTRARRLGIHHIYHGYTLSYMNKGLFRKILFSAIVASTDKNSFVYRPEGRRRNLSSTCLAAFIESKTSKSAFSTECETKSGPGSRNRVGIQNSLIGLLFCLSFEVHQKTRSCVMVSGNFTDIFQIFLGMHTICNSLIIDYSTNTTTRRNHLLYYWRYEIWFKFRIFNKIFNVCNVFAFC